jgi:hypothetical protein
MKKGVLSICIAIAGIYFVYWFNTHTYQQYSVFTEQSKNTLESKPYIIIIAKTFKINSVCLGLLSLYFGIISFLKKSKLGGLGVILALILIVCSFIPFWKYL